jgi:hypothetical protein
MCNDKDFEAHALPHEAHALPQKHMLQFEHDISRHNWQVIPTLSCCRLAVKIYIQINYLIDEAVVMTK